MGLSGKPPMAVVIGSGLGGGRGTMGSRKKQGREFELSKGRGRVIDAGDGCS